MDNHNIMLLPSVIDNSVLRGAADEYTDLQRLDTHGVMGDSYIATAHTSGKKVFIKMPHLPKEDAWDFFFVKDKLARVFAALFAEFANFSRLTGLTCVAQVTDIGIVFVKPVKLFPILLPFIVQEYLEGRNLHSFFENRESPFNGIENSQGWFIFSFAVASSLLSVHDRNVVHGDLHPGNIMVEGNSAFEETSSQMPVRIKIIDFGQAFLADCSLSAPEPTKRNPNNNYLDPQRREGEHWSFSSDIYSLGTILFYMATGKAPEISVPVGDHAGYIADQINSINPGLVRDEPGISKIIAKATEPNPSRRYSRVAELIRDLELFRLNYRPMAEPTQTEITNVVKLGKKSLKISNPLLREMAIDSFRQLERKISSLVADHPRFEVIGDREELISQMLHYLSVLKEGDEYWTITAPLFWQPQNLGYNGRFMSMNEVMARRGAQIRRIFMATDEDLNSQLWQNIVTSHQRILQNLRATNRFSDEAKLREAFNIRFRRVSKEQQEEVQGINHIVGLWVKRDSYTAIGFTLGEDKQTVRKATFWSPEQGIAEGILSAMKKELENSTPLLP